MQSAVPLKIQFLFVHVVLQRIIRLKPRFFASTVLKSLLEQIFNYAYMSMIS